MKISLLNLRKKKGRKVGSPLKNDPALVAFLSRLPTVNDYGSFELWRREFLERLGYFLIDEGVEKLEEAYHVVFRVKVEKLVRVISKIAHHVNDGSLRPTNVTIQARNSLDEGMKTCDDISTYLKVLSPMNVVEENIVGFTKYNTAAVLVETGFHEYERLNMCRDILQVLRENFVNPIAGPEHIAAFDKYEKEIGSFKSIMLQDVGLLPVLKKQRQLKSPSPPRAIVAEIRRGVLREALVSKSPLLANRSRVEKDPSNEPSKPKKTRKKTTSKSPLRRRQKSKSPKRPAKRSVDDDAPETKRSPSQPRRRKKSKSPKRKLSSPNPKSGDENPKTNRSSSRRRGGRNTSLDEDGNGEGFSRSLQKQSLQNRTNKSKSRVSRETIREERGLSPSNPNATKQALNRGSTAGFQKSETLVFLPKAFFPSQGRRLPEDERSMSSSVQRKNRSKLKAKKARKGKPLLKNAARERNTLTTRKALHIQEFPVHTQPGHSDTVKKPIERQSDGLKFEKLNQDAGTKATRDVRNQKSEDQGRALNGRGSGLQIESNLTSKRCDSFELINYMNSTKEGSGRRFDAPIHGKETKNRKKKSMSRSFKQKKKSLKNDDYRKIIHGKSYQVSGKMELPKYNMTRPFPVLVSTNISSQDAAEQTGNDSVGSKFLSSLLGNSDSPSHDEDESSILQHTTPYEKLNLFATNNDKLQKNNALFGNLGKKSTLPSFGHGNVQNTGGPMNSVSSYCNNYFEKPSFYDNFVKPITTNERDSTGNNEGRTLKQFQERWEGGRDIFEDRSVCSSRYVAGQSSIDEAIAKFNSDETIMELQRLNEAGNEKGEEFEIQKKADFRSQLSPTSVVRNENLLERGVTKSVESMETRKISTRGTKKINMKKQRGFFENSAEYSEHHQTKEILTAEEEAARMADEVAKLQIALEDHQHALDLEEEAQEEFSEVSWKFKEESEEFRLTGKMLKLKINEEKPPTNRHDLIDKEKKGNETNIDLDDEEEYFREVELKMRMKNSKAGSRENELSTNCTEKHDEEGEFGVKGGELEMAANILKLNLSIDNENDDDDDDDEEEDETERTDEEETEENDLDTSHFQEVSDALDMVEKMLELEASKTSVLNEEILSPGRFLGSRSISGGLASAIQFEDPLSNVDATLEEPDTDGVPSDSDYEDEPNPAISSKPAKKLEYPETFSLHTNNIASTRQLGKSPKGKESLTLATSKQNRKYRAGQSSRSHYSNTSSFKRSMIREDKGVRVYDPSARLSRWQAPQEKKRVI